MNHFINPVIETIQLSAIRDISNKAAERTDVIDLSVGQPDLLTPDHIKSAGKRAIDENNTKYTDNAGIFELRKSICRFLNQKYDLDYRPEDQIIVTNGATEALDITFRTILSRGDEVIIPAPAYVGYEPLIKLCGAEPVYVDTSKNRFEINAQLIEQHINSRTRCIILNNPSNPTGYVIDRQDLKEIAELARKYHLFIVSDEIYSELTFEDTFVSAASFDCVKDQTILINGLSKSHSMTGWRIGFVAGPEYLVNAIFKVHQYCSTCASSISQYAAIEALENGLNDPVNMSSIYQQRRDFVFERLQSMGLEVIKPKGAFYIFPKIDSRFSDSLTFSKELLLHEKVAVVPGSAFSVFGEGYVRLSYAASMKSLQEGMTRIVRFLR
ncbi:aminotransferase class I/II-fold pyridoxal phosphate-dependent enzyme [Sporolactobacillus sp. THM7-7]|nr:aminotransferase class I/II-fold pyridoxal phosphate-dependent enzyme [Sporolactobacillus sp. THM7-7]